MTRYAIHNGRLFVDDQPARFVESPNVTPGGLDPRFLVHHFTGGGAPGAIETLTKRGGGVSAHAVIAEDGAVTQLVDFQRIAWHAGRSSWRDVTGSLNPVSIGLEIANYGDAVEGSPGNYSAFGHRIPDDRVIMARHANGGAPRLWHTYPAAQMAAVIGVSRALQEAYHFEDVVGHDQIAPDRKVDPGPAFDMAMVRAAVLGVADVSDVGAPPTAPVDLPDHSAMMLQRSLNRMGFGPLDVDGAIGSATKDAVARFQAAHGLDADGVAGSKTWAAIDAAMASGG